MTFDVRKGRRARPRTDFLVVHTALTFPDQECNAKVIDDWHRQRGFDGIGYHKVILRDGTIENGRPLDEFGAHTVGYNGTSVGIVLAGGYQKIPLENPLVFPPGDGGSPARVPEKWVVSRVAQPKKGDPYAVIVRANYTPEQLSALADECKRLLERYPGAQVVGHRDLTKDGRSCPVFNVKAWWAEIQAGRTLRWVPTEW